MRPVIMIACLCLALASSARAQTSPAPSDGVNLDQVWQTVSRTSTTEDQERAQIMRVLNNPLTSQLSREYRLDLDAAKRMVPTLSGSELQQISQRAATAESALAGGDTVTISTTVIIIVLLIVILILVA
jgi:hypothetical protein